MLRSIIERILTREGGMAHHPADKGGATNWGLTLPFLLSLLGRVVDERYLATVTRDEARQHYLHWAQQCGFDRICDAVLESDRAFVECVIDWAVNAGPARAINMLQSIVGVKQDGIIGPDTIAALSQRAGTWSALPVVKSRIQHRVNRVLADQSQLAFLRGWINRDLEFLS